MRQFLGTGQLRGKEKLGRVLACRCAQGRWPGTAAAWLHSVAAAETARIFQQISDVVPIVSVVTSGVVGVVGLSSTVYIARAQRRWQSHEERVADLRLILDSAGADIAQTVMALGEANWAAEGAFGEFKSDVSRRDGLLVQGRRAVDGSLVPRGSLRTTCNRLSVRLGGESPVPIALLDVHSELVTLGRVVSEQLDTGPDMTRYNAAWNAAEEAERSFYAAAADALKPPRATRRWLRR